MWLVAQTMPKRVGDDDAVMTLQYFGETKETPGLRAAGEAMMQQQVRAVAVDFVVNAPSGTAGKGHGSVQVLGLIADQANSDSRLTCCEKIFGLPARTSPL